MKKNYLSKFVVATIIAATGFLTAYSGNVSAALLENEKIKITQPDGQVIQCFASGDEFYNYLHDENGRAIIKDQKTGYYVYGKYVKNTVVPSRERVTLEKTESLKNVEKDSRVNMNNVKAPVEEIQKEREKYNAVNQNKKTKNIGKLNNIVIFIKFSDQEEITRNLSTYESQFNGKDRASLSNFYKEASFDQLDINTSFYPKANGNKVISYKDKHPRSYYENLPKQLEGQREQALLKNAVDSVKNQIPKDLDIDSDNDGIVDNVCFIVKGEAEGWNKLLWPHKWNMYYEDVEINGKKVDNYNFQLEEFIGDNKIGVLSHEMFHTLGAPDLYHYNDDGRVAVGPWDVMDRTSNIPQSMGAYMKMFYGQWMNKIDEIDKPGNYSINDISKKENNSYIIKSPKSDSEYFVVEYRNQKGIYEENTPSDGLLVYRINKNLEGRGNASGQDEVYVYRPNGSLYSNGDIYNAALGKDKKSISSKELFLSNGSESGIELKDIKIENNKASFNVVIDGKEIKVEDDKDKDKILPFAFNVNFDDSKEYQGPTEIDGLCVYGKNIKNVELFINGYKYMNAKFYEIKDPEQRLKGYDLTNGGFKFNLNFSNWKDANYPYKIEATTGDGFKSVLKEGFLKIKHTSDVAFKGTFNLDEKETLKGAIDLTGECFGKDIETVRLFVNGYYYMDAERYEISNNEMKNKGYDLSRAGYKFGMDFTRWHNEDYPYKVVATDKAGKEYVIKEGTLKIRN